MWDRHSRDKRLSLLILANTKISQHVCSCRFSTQQTTVRYCRSYLYRPCPFAKSESLVHDNNFCLPYQHSLWVLVTLPGMADSSVAKILTINLVLLRVNVNFYWGSDGRASGLCSYTSYNSEFDYAPSLKRLDTLRLRSLINSTHGMVCL